MKQFLIFSIFVCFAAAKTSNFEEGMKLAGREKIAMAECARELNVDEKKYEHAIDLGEYEKSSDEEATCMMACSFRKLFSKKLTGSDNKETLYNGFKAIVEGAFKAGLQESKVSYTREGVLNKLETCYDNAQSECEFYKCTEFLESPMFEMFFYLNFINQGSSIFDV